MSYIIWTIAAMLIAKSCLAQANAANAAHFEDWLCGTPHLSLAHKPQDPQLATSRLLLAPPRAIVDRVGEQRNFYVHIPSGKRVTATCARVGKHAYIYVDSSKLALVTDANLDDLINEFDTRIYPKTHELFGSEWKPGIDRDTRVTILLHDVEDNQSARGFGGYFDSSDEDPAYLYSNMREMVYVDVYYFKERDKWTLHSTLAHEFTHMINWAVNGRSPEESWLDEGLASFAEWTIYQLIHLIYLDGFLQNSSAVSLTDSSLPENRYGASFLLLLYLYEKYGGKDIISDISNSKAKGIRSLNEALKARGYKEKFEEIFKLWTLANYFNDTRFNEQLGYKNIAPTRRAKLKADNTFSSYPIRVGGLLREWSAEYAELRSPPADLKLTFETKSGEGFLPMIVQLAPDRPPRIFDLALDKNGNGIHQLRDIKADETLLLVIISTLGGSYIFQAGRIIDANFDLKPKPAFFRDEIVETSRRDISTDWSIGSILQPGGLLSSDRRLTHFGDLHISGKYSGLAATKDNVFVASGWGLDVFSTSALGNLKKVGELPLPGFAEDVSVKGKYAYVASGRLGVQVVDVSDPANPRLVGSYQPTEYAHMLVTSNTKDLAYVVDLTFGLKVLDLQNPLRPSLAASYETKGLALSVYVSDAYAYFSDTEKGLSILDIRDPRQLVLVGQYKGGRASGMQVVDKYAYLARGDIEVIDVSDPKNPQKFSSIQISGLANRISVQGNLAFVSDSRGTFRTWDLTDLRNPLALAEIKWTGSAAGMATSGRFVYLTDDTVGLRVIDVSDPFKPKLTQIYRNDGIAFGLASSSGYVYVADGDGGLKIIDVNVKDPARATLINSSWLGGLVMDVTVNGNYAYVALADEGLKILDISNPLDPRITGELKGLGNVSGVSISGGYAYLSAASLVIVDVSLPDRPALVSSLELPGYAYKIRVGATHASPLHAYIAALDGGLQVVDVSDPKSPRLAGSYLGSGDIKSVDFASGYAYAADSRDGFLIIDIRDLRSPQLVGSYATNDEINDIKVWGNYALLTSQHSLRLLEVSDRKSPKLLGEVNGLKWASASIFDPDAAYAYATDLYQLRAFKLELPKPPLAVDSNLETTQDQDPVSSRRQLKFRLGQNFPNPANPETWIPFELAEDSKVTLEIYGIRGELIRKLELGEMYAGSYKDRNRAAPWDGKNQFGETVASGIYFYLLKAGKFSAIRKLQVVK